MQACDGEVSSVIGIPTGAENGLKTDLLAWNDHFWVVDFLMIWSSKTFDVTRVKGQNIVVAHRLKISEIMVK